MLRKKDLYLILPALLIAAAFFIWMQLPSHSAGIAVVEKDGKEVGRYDLGAQKTSRIIDIGGTMHVKLLLEPGAVSFYHSDCPDQICVRTGKISKPGQAAVCLPGRVSVRIVSRGGGNRYDGYTG